MCSSRVCHSRVCSSRVCSSRVCSSSCVPQQSVLQQGVQQQSVPQQSVQCNWTLSTVIHTHPSSCVCPTISFKCSSSFRCRRDASYSSYFLMRPKMSGWPSLQDRRKSEEEWSGRRWGGDLFTWWPSPTISVVDDLPTTYSIAMVQQHLRSYRHIVHVTFHPSWR